MVMMEAMCAGCAVPNTGSGGAIELSERAGTPLFPKDHPFALSRLLSALEKDRLRVAEIALRGQQTVLREFTINQMLEKTCDVVHAGGRAAFSSRTADGVTCNLDANLAHHPRLLSSDGGGGALHRKKFPRGLPREVMTSPFLR